MIRRVLLVLLTLVSLMSAGVWLDSYRGSRTLTYQTSELDRFRFVAVAGWFLISWDESNEELVDIQTDFTKAWTQLRAAGSFRQVMKGRGVAISDLTQPKGVYPGEDDGIWTFASCRTRTLHVEGWIIPLLAGPYPLLVCARSLVRRRYRIRKGLCLRCGYNLMGNRSGVCPECGRVCRVYGAGPIDTKN